MDGTAVRPRRSTRKSDGSSRSTRSTRATVETSSGMMTISEATAYYNSRTGRVQEVRAERRMLVPAKTAALLFIACVVALFTYGLLEKDEDVAPPNKTPIIYIESPPVSTSGE